MPKTVINQLAFLLVLANGCTESKLKITASSRSKLAGVASNFSITGPVALGTNPTPTVTWGEAIGTDVAYDLKIGTSANCANQIQIYSNLRTTSQVLSSLADGAYFACLVAKDSLGNSALAANTNYSFSVDTTGPAVTFSINADPFVKAGDSQSLAFNVTDSSAGVSSLSWAYAEDGKTFGSETAINKADGTITMTIPTTANSALSAKIRITATDSLGNISKTISSPFQIATKWSDLYKIGTFAFGGADGTAFLARYSQITSAVLNGTDMYIADAGALRKINITNGTATTIAGLSGFVGTTDGQGRYARVSSSVRQMVVLNNYLYLVDSGNQVIRKLDINSGSASYGTLTTVAGGMGTAGTADGTGTAARFSGPWGMVTDGTYLYISDSNNYTIRKLDPATAAVTTVAGTAGLSGIVDSTGSSARFSSPRDMVYDSGTGAFYISEVGNLDIRKVVISSMAVTTLTGTSHKFGAVDGTAATTTFTGMGGITCDGTYLYLIDYWAHTIRRTALSDGSTTTISGIAGDQGYAEGNSATAKWSTPAALVYYNSALYVGDSNNLVIRKLDLATNTTSLFSGAPYGTAGFDSVTSGFGANVAHMEPVWGMATTDGNAFYFTQINSSVVRKLDIASNTITTIAGTPSAYGITDGSGSAARFRYPWGIVKVGTALYVADYDANNIRKIDLAGGNAVTVVAGSTTGLSGTTDDPVGTNARFNAVRGLESDGTYLYAADFSNHRVRRITIGGTWNVTTIAGSSAGYLDHTTGTSAQFNGPVELGLSGTNLYVADQSNNAVRKIDLTTNAVTTIAGANGGTVNGAGLVDGAGTAAKFSAPRRLVVIGSNLYIADYSNSRIRKIDLSSNTVSTVAGGGNANYSANYPGMGLVVSVVNPAGMTAYSNTLYFGSGNLFNMRSFDLTTNYVKIIAGVNTSSLYSNRVGAGTKDGAALQSMNMLSHGVVVGSSIYSTAMFNNTIQKMNLDGTGLTTIAGADMQPGNVDGVGTAARMGIIARPITDGRYLYFIDYSASTVRRMSLADNTVDTIAGFAGQNLSYTDGTGSAARFGFLSDLALVNGDLYADDKSAFTIRKISLQASSFGVVTTVAGAPGSSGYVDGTFSAARFNGLSNMVAIGNVIYLSENTNNVIRKIDISNNTVSTLAGAGGVCDYRDSVGTAAKFCLPGSITTDGSNLYVMDTGNVLVRKIRISDGSVTTFYGVLYQGRDPSPSSPFITNQTMSSGVINFQTGLGLLLYNFYGVKLIN